MGSGFGLSAEERNGGHRIRECVGAFVVVVTGTRPPTAGARLQNLLGAAQAAPDGQWV